jgi:GWxTD domain-containing protein
MKSIFILFSFIALMTNISLAKDLDTYITVNRFYDIVAKKHYVEISYFIPSTFVAFEKNSNQLYQGKLKTSIVVANKNEIVNSKIYILQSTEYNSLDRISADLKDVVRLYVPVEDTLSLAISIQDVNDTSASFYSEIDIFVKEKESGFLSDIMLINSADKSKKINPFSRNGLSVMPKFLNYYPTEIKEVKFYTEFYQKETFDKYLVRYLITNEEGVFVDGYASHKRIDSQAYASIVSGFDISELPSGNYYLFMELKDSSNNIIERKRTFFQRSNKAENVVKNVNEQKGELAVITNNFAKKYNLANIKHHINALGPIANTFEIATINSFEYSDNLEQMQNYFFSFWKGRNANSPEAEWMAYAKTLQYVEKTFTNMTERGFETDRGIVYLMNGKPFFDKLYRRNGQEFWVWNYERIDNQGDVYFVFLNKNSITDDFEMVHSSLKNELYDKGWAEFIRDEL